MTQAITQITGTGIPIIGNDIDTDQIIPARYLKEITFDNMGKYLFHDNRFNEDGSPKDHPLNEEKYKSGSILVVNNNFGCGSSREHAPQAIKRYGINAVIGESFGEIFSGNCKAIGIPNIILDKPQIAEIQATLQENPNIQMSLNLEGKVLTIGDKVMNFDMDEPKRNSLVSGTWDAASLLNENQERIQQTAKRLPYLNNFQ